MSKMINIRCGEFGRAALLDLRGSLVEHSHSQGHLLFWLGGDPCAMNVANACFPFNAERAVAVNSWEPHAVVAARADQRCLFLLFYLDPEWMAGRCAALGVAPRFAERSFAVSRGLGSLVDACKKVLSSEQDGVDFDGCVRSIFDRSMTNIASSNDQDPASEGGRYCIDFRVRKAVDFMKTNVDGRKNFEDVARAAGLSRPHFFSLFRQHMHLTPSIYWNTLRMERAIERLVSSDVSLSEIADDLGFSEPGNFSRFFRNHAGVCPSQYRLVAAGPAAKQALARNDNVA
ncbi:MAG: AraC family transcriptional regulator [Pseudomonadota bacterium]